MKPLPDYPSALAAMLQVPWTVTTAEGRDLAEAHGCYLAQTLVADRDLPPFDRITMDGYALRAADLTPGRSFPIAGDLPAGAAPPPDVPRGQCLKVATGASLPPMLDTVVPHEWTDRNDPLTLQRLPERGHAVHQRGEDAPAGAPLVPSGVRLGPVEIGLAATVGQARIEVHARPRVTILASGDEVVPIADTPGPDQIRDSNLMMVTRLLERMGGDIQQVKHLPDEIDATQQAVSRSLETTDALVTIGGISEGSRDVFRRVLDQMAVDQPVRGVAMQPGKPVTISAFGSPSRLIPILSLPGNPVSALATACLFAGPMLSRIQGGDGTLPWLTGFLAQPAAPHRHRRRFRPVQRTLDGGLVVPSWRGSGDLAHAAETIGLVDLPAGPAPLAAGSAVHWLAWP